MTTGHQNGAIALSEDQEVVMAEIRRWRGRHKAGHSQQTLTVGGYAGTGKTTIISKLLHEVENVAVAALAGKAAQVLRQKGVPATTIHYLIYTPEEQADGSVIFRKKKTLDFVRFVIIDEASMVNYELMNDLLSFNLPVLFVGDHGQLEPIGDNPNLMANPTLRLEKIHRQAADNPILRCAHNFRENCPVLYQDDNKGRLSVRRRPEFWTSIDAKHQIICGYNATRHKVNRIVREQLGRKGTVVEGERIIVLKNNAEAGVFNGQQLTVVEVRRKSPRSVRLYVQDDEDRSFEITVMVEQFGRELIKDHRDRSTILADYAYCITCHKSQGSEYPSVLVLDELASSWDPRRWRYTAATRAKEQLIYCM